MGAKQIRRKQETPKKGREKIQFLFQQSGRAVISSATYKPSFVLDTQMHAHHTYPMQIEYLIHMHSRLM